ncbi:MAG: ABC transporter ATP-binding protein [Thermomicrobiaceae bacterium]|nr:ABC transporter ATP-binding protein [Thermomicrobiaceae bacterium]
MATPIAVEHLTYSYGQRRGVIDLTFSVEEGEIFGFLGPNGAGKTTTIRQLMGFMRPASGSARIFGLDCWADAPRVKAKVGFLPGELHLYDQMTGREFLDFFAAFRGGDDPARRKMLVERLELDLDARIRHLSKGNRQKLAIAQALMHDAPLLILDEPSSGLDPLMQVGLLDLLREEQARGKTVFLSSHVLSEVERIANRVAIIREGRLVAVESVARLKALRERTMELTLAAPVPLERFSAIEGVRVLAVDPSGRHVQLGVRGELGPLLRLLGELPVEDLVFGPPDLESIFLHFYGEAPGAGLTWEEVAG